MEGIFPYEDRGAPAWKTREEMISRGWINSGFKWDHRMVQLAKLNASWSKDPSTKVGCVIADDDNHVISMGYNGFPAKIEDNDRLFDRDVKYQIVVHAEVNASIQAGKAAKGCTAFVTHPPCASCMGVLLNCGIKRVVCPLPSQDYLSRWNSAMQIAEAMAKEAGVELAITSAGD